MSSCSTDPLLPHLWPPQSRLTYVTITPQPQESDFPGKEGTGKAGGVECREDEWPKCLLLTVAGKMAVSFQFGRY